MPPLVTKYFRSLFLVELLERHKRSSRNLVIGFYPDERQADIAIGRLKGEGFFRSASVSLTGNGRHTVKGHSSIILTAATLVAAAVMIVPLLTQSYSWTYVVLLAGIVYMAGIALGPYMGFALPRSVLREYGPRILPGESMVIAQCTPDNTQRLGDLLQENEEAKPIVFIIRPYLKGSIQDKRPKRELLSYV